MLGELVRKRSCYVIMELFWLLVSNIVVEATGITANHFSTPLSIVSSTSDNRDYNYELFDPENMLKIGSDYCKSKKSCSEGMFESFPGKSCYCDQLCTLLDDCCSNFDSHIETEATLNKEQFSCVHLMGVIKNENYGVHMVTKCSEKWEHKYIKLLCETSANSTDDIFLKLPVSHKSVMYQNMYCAQCNFMYTFEYWKPEMKCQNETGVRSLPDRADCDLFFLPPRPDVGYRTCQMNPRVIESCLDTDDEYTIETKENCTDGDYSIVYDSSGNAYRNKQCASCNGNTGDLFCDVPEPSNPFNNTPTQTPRKVYSFRILVDFNKATVNKNGEISNIGNCNDNELYDSFSEKCREILCPPPLLPVKGMCVVNHTHITNDTVKNCSFVKLDASEYIITNDSRLFILSSNQTYLEDEFQVFKNDVFVCLTSTDQRCNCDDTETLFQYDILESYLSMAGLIISITALSVTLIVYVTFSQLMNIPGKILVCLITALLVAQLLFLIAALFENIVQLCITVALLTHYFYLSSFCWMNVIALDLWMTFSNSFMSGGSRRNNRRFLKYSLYAWLTPLLIVTCAVIFDFSPLYIEDVSLKPRYGVKVCWISSKNGLLLFFAGPLAILKLFDIISFIFTAVHITRANRQGAMAAKSSRSCSLLINIKLSLIMGLTWVFAFIANITNETVIWYLFIVFNSLQGLFIAVCFLCTRKVGRMLYDKYEQISSKSTSGTRLSSLSQSAKIPT